MTGMYARIVYVQNGSTLLLHHYRRKKEIGGTLMLTRYADDWVAVWNGSRDRAEIKAFLANVLKLKLRKDPHHPH